jgi:putative oxidoreductase
MEGVYIAMLKTLGRLLLAKIFIYSGANAFMNPDALVSKVAAAGVPKPRQSTILNGAVMFVAGSMLALDIAPKLSAALLAISLIPTTLVGHPFWNEEDPGNRANQQIHFLKNLAIIGGLLIVLAEKNDD